MAVFEGTLILKVMGEDNHQDHFDTYLGNADPAQILREMDQGDLIGISHFFGSHAVPEGEVSARLVEMGNDGSLFLRDDEDLDETESGADPVEDIGQHLEGRLLRAQMRGDITAPEIQMMLLDFVRDAGLMAQFVDRVESRADEIAQRYAPGPA